MAFKGTKLYTVLFSTAAAIAVALGGAAPASAASGDVINPLASKTYNYGSEFGGRCVPTLWASANHLGQDFGAADGTTIRSIADGTVHQIRQPSGSSVSGRIVVKHKIDGKTYYSAYLHMWKPSQYVKVGQKVSKGQRIAKVGSSGPSTGPHLHLEIWENAYKGNGTIINPTTFMLKNGVNLKTQASRITTKAQPANCTYYATSNTTLKATPSSSSITLMSVPKGTKMSSPNKVSTQSGNYLKAVINGKTGWIYRGSITRSYVAPTKPVTPAAKPVPSAQYTNNSVNFRTGAGTNYKVIQYLAKNTNVTATGVKSGNWVQVKYGSKTGWISGNYLTKGTAPKTSTSGASTGKTTATTPYHTRTNVNFRTGASTKYKSIQYLKKHTNVAYTGKKSGGWLQVKVGSKTGWISGNYLVKGNAPKSSVKTSTSGAAKGAVKTTSKTTAYHTKSSVNFRTGASTKHKVIKKFSAKTNVAFTGKKSGNWWQVKQGGKTGWVDSKYLTKGNAPKSSAKSSTAKTTHYAKANVNFRTGASTKHKVISTVKKNANVTATGKKSGGWLQVKVGNKTGWISGNYLIKGVR